MDLNNSDDSKHEKCGDCGCGEKITTKYWGSLSQYSNDPQFIERAKAEFISTPLREGETEGGFNRRDFMKLMAASSALATSACFQRPMHKILPYVNQPEEITLGNANWYASTCGECSTGCGVLVKTREGRPIKLEGNPDHPMNQGGLCARGQASLLNLYDPDRLRNAVSIARGTTNTVAMKWADVDAKLSDKLKTLKSSGGKIRILTGTLTSPSTLKLVNDFVKGFGAGSTHVTWDPVNAEDIATAQELSYGARVVPRYLIDKANVIVAIESDFLGTFLSPVEFTKQFAKNRRVSKNKKHMSKLITFESMMTLAGTNADVRVPIRPEDGARVALAIAHELVKTHNAKVDSETAEILKLYSAEGVAGNGGFNAGTIEDAAKELWGNRGKSLAIAGSAQAQSQNGLSLQIAVNLLNSLLGNDGATIDVASPSLQSQGGYTELLKLVKDMDAGAVDALFIYKANPAYALPKSVGFQEATKKVGLIVSSSDRVDETASLCDFVLPDNHALESWGDAEPQKGLYSLVQPTIRPVYETRSFQDSLLALSKGVGIASLSNTQDFHAYVQNYWRENIFKGIAGSFQDFWDTALRDGVYDSIKSRKTSSPRAFKTSALKANVPKPPTNDFALTFYAPLSLGDGRSANNAWLQELPDPVTRIAWDNYASISPKTATKLGIVDGDVVRVKFGSETIELPAHVQPGLHEKVVAVALGYGREAAGSVGTKIGQNMFGYSKAIEGQYPRAMYSGFPISMIKTGAKYMLAAVQEHHVLEGRPIVKDASLKEYQENPTAGNEEHDALTTIWKNYEYKGYRWHMAIDMNSCTGCSACVVGCQSENNIPVVGKDGVARGRIMHWMRIDRYYSGTPDNPMTAHQPMLCQHCENAPCETVCPVIATAHDDEGLNQQIYNRCVGTRYCANNCPYKVRRFNWFEYNYGGQTRYPLTLAQNPEVTVRSRGVMEKCTFCVQRIHDEKNKAKDMNTTVKDGDLKTACQQSCPADAIVFGNINDTESLVHQAAHDPRGYTVLEDLNTRPSITYLTKIRNTENV